MRTENHTIVYNFIWTLQYVQFDEYRVVQVLVFDSVDSSPWGSLGWRVNRRDFTCSGTLILVMCDWNCVGVCG